MKKVLFIDRDGTLVKEPQSDFQVDSFSKLEFLPGVFTYLGRIARELDFELVMVTNQDGLGTPSFPEENFHPVQNFIVSSLAAEDIHFSGIFIDRSFEHENSPNRKPRTGMLGKFLDGTYDLANSYVIGDRNTDYQLAINLGSKAILFPSQFTNDMKLSDQLQFAESWKQIYELLRLGNRKIVHSRATAETTINIELDLDGTGKSQINTGLSFFDHMLDQLARHSGSDLRIEVKGDLHIDEHHTIEDTAIALGEAYNKALGNKIGIDRYGFCLPMDDCLAQVAIDFGGRNWIVWNANFNREKIGDMPTEMFYHFFKSFSDAARCNLNVQAEGQNEHHKIEAIFKALAKAIKMAVRRDVDRLVLPTTKGLI